MNTLMKTIKNEEVNYPSTLRILALCFFMGLAGSPPLGASTDPQLRLNALIERSEALYDGIQKNFLDFSKHNKVLYRGLYELIEFSSPRGEFALINNTHANPDFFRSFFGPLFSEENGEAIEADVLEMLASIEHFSQAFQIHLASPEGLNRLSVWFSYAYLLSYVGRSLSKTNAPALFVQKIKQTLWDSITRDHPHWFIHFLRQTAQDQVPFDLYLNEIERKDPRAKMNNLKLLFQKAKNELNQGLTSIINK